MRLATEAVELARGCGLLDAVEDGEVHTAYGVALAAHGRMDEALPELERGVFLRRLWGQPLDLVDGLIELAGHLAAVGDRRRATRRLRRGGADPRGVRRPRRPAGTSGRGATCARASGGPRATR